MNKIIYISISISLIIGMGIIFFGSSEQDSSSMNSQSKSNIEIKDGIQYITINSKGGYSPKISTAKANIPTKLIIKTNDTYDCSSALVIKSINHQKTLPPTGEEIIDLETPKSGALKGLCSMGMYSFSVNFE